MSLDQQFTHSPPTTSSAMSAFIKSIRLRKPDFAIRYLLWLWEQDSKTRERVQRRILICAAEDNLSVPVMDAASRWYGSLMRRKLEAATTVALKIIATPNWYAVPEGRDYIRAWRAAEIGTNPYRRKSEECLHKCIETLVRGKELLPAMRAFNALYERHRGFDRRLLAEIMVRLALEQNNSTALSIASIYENHMSELWTDGNYAGQALYTLIVGPIGQHPNPDITKADVSTALQRAQLQQAVLAVPAWALDGIHTGGRDPRFAGTVKMMAGCCAAYEHYGRLSPDDEWLKSFTEVRHES